MPKNLTGGNKAKGFKNRESAKSIRNRTIIEDLVYDYIVGGDTDGVHVGRVTKKFGSGRMEAFFVEPATDTTPSRERVINCPLSSRMRGGYAKKDVWVDVDSVVILTATGFKGNSEYEIVAVLNHEQCASLRDSGTELDPRIFAKPTTADEEEGVIFEKEGAEAEVDIDRI